MKELEKTAKAFQTKCIEVDNAAEERRTVEEDKHQGEVNRLKAVNDSLKESLEALLAPPATSTKKL